MSDEIITKPVTVECDESNTTGTMYGINEVETDEVITYVEPESALEKLYSKLINKKVSIYDMFNQSVCAYHSGVLKEVVVSSTDETVYLSLECKDGCHNLKTIVCVGCGISVVEHV
jgi:hypothetical protein